MRLRRNRSKGSRWMAVCLVFSAWATGQDLATQAWHLERGGDGEQALASLRQAAAAGPNDPVALRAYAEFLERHHDPAAREIYARLGQLLQRTGAPAGQRAAVSQRLAVLDLLAGDREASARDLRDYSAAGGKDLALPPIRTAPAANYIEIPGPLRSFARMAALSPDLAPKNCCPPWPATSSPTATRRPRPTKPWSRPNISSWWSAISLKPANSKSWPDQQDHPHRDLRIDGNRRHAARDRISHARRLRIGRGARNRQRLARISHHRFRIPSGRLEQALRTNRPFKLDYHPARVPILYTVEYWQPPAKDKSRQNQGEFIDYFLSDPSLCRLYLGLSKLDPETAE